MTRAELPPDTTHPLLEVSVGDRVRAQALRRPEAPAVTWQVGQDLHRLSYGELLVAAEAAAAAIASVAAPGDRVAVWGRNSPEWVVLEVASALTGTVLAPFNTGWSDDEVRHALALTTPKVVYADPDGPWWDRATSLAPDLVAPLPSLNPPPVASVELPVVSPEDPFLIQFTSGTTGQAKGATLSHRAALNAGWIRVLTAEADEDDVWLNPVPLHHVGGSCVVLLAVLGSGGCYVVMPRFDAPTMLDLLRATCATRIGGVPTMLLDLLAVPDAADAFASVKSAGIGGSAVPPSLIRRLRDEHGVAGSIGFAQSECPMVTQTLADEDPEIVATSVGVAAPHTAIRILSPSGEVVGLGEVGEVCVRSPMTMIGYFDNPEATAEVFDADGFLHTGDLGSLDEHGVLRIHGRAREVVIRSGENIYPAEIEAVLQAHPAVAGVAVIGVPSERRGEEVGAVVRLAAPATAEELATFAGSRLARFKVPEHWLFVDAFPMTSSGKIRKVDLAGAFTSNPERTTR